MAKKVEFFSEGIKLVGYLYTPNGLRLGEKRSGIVLCHGFAAHQERYLPDIAQYLCGAGYVVLTFDYRGFGESDGPRWRLIPLEQVQDIANAVTFLQIQDGVESGSIGLYGTSFGGANVCHAALDDRIKCTVNVVGVGCGQRWLKSLRRAWEWKELLQELREDRVRRIETGESRVVDRLHIMLPDPASKAQAEEIQIRFPASCTHIPLETAQAVIDYHPEEVISRVAPNPMLFVVAEEDVLVPNEVTREVYDRAGQPKKWVVIPGCGHYDVYFPPIFEQVMAEATSWYTQHLPVAGMS